MWASDGVTLGIRRGEAFGLLGPNGAGKTTLFNMMAGNEEVGGPTHGHINVFGADAWSEGFRKARERMAIVPQFDCLVDFMSGREHLRLFARLSGLYYAPAKDSKTSEEQTPLLGTGEEQHPIGERRVALFLQLVGLSAADGDRPAGDYSGGMKRKLSMGCALITDPELLYLDELSAGVDIVAQRTLWRLLTHRPVGQTIVSTTHSMLEADSTCDRLGVLVAGRLKALGDTNRLKDVMIPFISPLHQSLCAP